jgi:hypothetical protein
MAKDAEPVQGGYVADFTHLKFCCASAAGVDPREFFRDRNRGVESRG